TVQINGVSMDASMGLDRAHMVKFKDLFLENGCHVVNIEYRRINILTPDDTKYTDMLDDVKSAVTFLKTNADYYKIDTTKIIMLGYSAGGHLAELYSYKVTDSPIPVKLCIGRAGPADFSNKKFRTCSLGGFASYPGLAAFFGLPENTSQTELENFFRCRLITNLLGIETDVTSDIDKIADDPNNQSVIQAASPIYHVKSTSPRTIILHGKKDPLVDYSIAESLDAKLTECGVTHDFITLPNADHGLSMTKSELQEFNSKVLAAIR
ncbi:MAG: alpha/beta hydrolase, partial [Spirochaetales bacterium]|nr:alpha/beta hydrolase [Spirochaetales bacterium]